MDQDEVLEKLVQDLSTSDDVLTRSGAAVQIGKLNGPRIVEALLRALGDEISDVRGSAS